MKIGYSTVCRYLRQWDYTRIRPRPHAMEADPERQAKFKQQVAPLITEPEVDLWFLDETGIWGHVYPYLVWAKRGSKPVVPYCGEHWRTSVIGAVRPNDGRFVAWLISTGNSQTVQVFLNELQTQVNHRKRNILILDNASFHHAKELKFGVLEPWYLPPYSPELNPIEELWLQLKKRFFVGWFPTSAEALEERVIEALNHYDEQPTFIKSVCAMTTYL